MSAVTFDKLTYVAQLEKAGIARKQAEAQADALDVALRDTVATKHDMELLRTEINGELRLLRWMTGLMLAGVVSLVVKSFF